MRPVGLCRSARAPLEIRRQVRARVARDSYVGARASTGRPSIVTALALLLLPALVVALGPLLWPADADAQNLAARLRPPSLAQPLGSDQFGRDLLARLLHGGRLTLGISLAATAANASLGIALGVLAAGRRGALDAALLRATDLLLAFPSMLLALAVAGLSGGGLRGLLLALGLFGWGTYARVARGEALQAQTLLFVHAARALGAGAMRVALQHVLPTITPPLLVLMVVRFGQTVLTIAGLSFLGVGVQPPTPEWGAMLSDGLPFIERVPQMLLVPGLAVTFACLSISLGAEELRRLLDPAR